MLRILSLLLLFQPAIVLCQVCATGWTLSGDNCYKLMPDSKNWHEAQISCENDGGNLAMPKTQDINDVLTQMINNGGSHWIGVHDISTEGNFIFSDNTPVTNPFWNSGEPNNDFGVEDCTEITTTGLWNDQDCYAIRPYLCMRDNDVIVKCDEGNGWISAADRCYKFYDTPSTWQDAQNYCQDIDGHLISVNSEAEQAVVSTQANFGGSTLWIGLRMDSGTYGWSSGETLGYTNWAPNQPDSRYGSSGGNCVEVLDTSNNGEWSTMTCTATQSFMCERAEGTCPEGWRLFRGYCYQFNSATKQTWSDAKHTCEAQGAYMTSVLSDVENKYIRDYFLDLENLGISSTWIGISDNENDGSFAWSEGSSVGYTNWSPNEPTDNANSPDCGSMMTAGGDGSWSTKNCFTLEAFVCKVRSSQPIFPLDPNNPIGSCEAGWTLNRDHCYKVVNNAAYFDDAEANCVSMGSHLTSVNDQEEQSFLSMRASMAERNLYIGFHDLNSENNFEWTDGSPVTFTNWGPNQPNDWSDDGQDCTFLKWEEDVEGIWDDVNCDKTRTAYVCKKAKIPGQIQPPPAVPTPVFDPRCGNGWEYDSISGNCYLFKTTDYRTWDDSRIQCKLGGGELLSIRDQTEQTYINARLVYVTQSSLWIGANDLSLEGGWQWSDGSGFAYLNWSPDEPNNYDPGEHCVQIYYATGQWNDFFCDREIGYICKKNGYLTTHYNVVSNYYLDGNDVIILQGMYPEDCAHACITTTDFNCLSFDYNRDSMECALSDMTQDMQGTMLRGGSNRDYYQRLTDVVDPVPTTIPPGYRCRNGWAPYGDNCYYVQIATGNYNQAVSQCRALGAELVSIHDANENSFIQSLYASAGINSAVWIGLNDLRVQMLFEWSDGTPVDYTYWNIGEPNNYNGNNEDCVEMFNNGAWNDIDCSSTIPSICKLKKENLPPTDQPITPSGCNLGEVAYGGSCYMAVTTPMSWTDAQNDCSNKGGNLVSIADRFEQSVVSSLLGLQDGTLFWIGLNDLGNYGEYAWSDMTAITFTHWDVGQPDDSNGYCVASSSGSAAGLWRNIQCDSESKYICERVRTGYTPRPTVPAPGPPTLPNDDGCYYGWVGYGGWCFKIETGEDPNLETDADKVKRSWGTARDVCVSDGAELASFHDPDEEAYIKSKIPMPDDGYWIGLHDRSVETGFEWSDRTPVDYTNWWEGEPNNAGNLGEDCVEMFGNHRNWNDKECSSLRNWICKLAKGVKPKSTLPPSTVTPWPQCPTDPDWVLFQDYCYFFSGGLTSSDKRLGWNDANSYCMQRGGYLVSLHSTNENNFLQSMLTRYTDSNDWIGLRTYSGSGFYEWSDESPLDFQSWNVNEPNDANGEEECAEFYQDGSWNDLNCGDKLSFVCKKAVSSVQPVTNAPTPVPQGNCPVGTMRFDNMCYRMIGANSADRNTWYNARDICRNTYNGDLATIHSQALQSFFITQMKGIDYQMYIGLSDSLNNGQFRWTDGTSVDYTNWNADEPNDHNGDEDCVEMIEPSERAGKWNDQTCNDYNAFICQSPLDPNAPAPPPQTSDCRSGFSQYGDSCFKVVPRTMSYSDAIQACRNEGADTTLASIIDTYENAFVETLLHYNGDVMLWLGLLDDKASGQYKWVDSHPVWYTNWGQGEPSQGSGEGCVAVGLGGWDDHSCSDQLGALCKYSRVPIPTNHPDLPGTCPESWISYGSDCYFFSSAAAERTSWPTAEYICRQGGGHLASIHSKQENEWIRNRLAQEFPDAWIGFEATPSTAFAWSDDTPVDYTNWNPGEPNSNFLGDEDCAEMYLETGKWNDLDCLTLQGYVCKTPKTPLSGQPTQAPPKTLAPGQTTKAQGPGENTKDTPTNSAPISSNGVSTGAIAGIIIGVVLIVCITGVLVFFLYSSRNKAPLKTPEIPTSTGFENVVYNEKDGTKLSAFETNA
ncbi:macrophage mannose receptor 1-like isoform X1 [Lytechinus pictus]|uniref:macrophage mannose receptor 1-like isoform X1 n=1 Tax=Lytechinus pictus TaxID=7653 RepID=UPI0030B9C626